MTEELRNEFIKKLRLCKLYCRMLLTHYADTNEVEVKVDEVTKVQVGLELFDAIDYALMSGDKVIKQHIQLMDFILKQLSGKVAEIGVAE